MLLQYYSTAVQVLLQYCYSSIHCYCTNDDYGNAAAMLLQNCHSIAAPTFLRYCSSNAALLLQCHSTVSALLQYCSSTARLLLQCCSNTFAILLRHCSNISAILLQCCCSTAQALVQYFSITTSALLHCCRSAVPISLLRYCCLGWQGAFYPIHDSACWGFSCGALSHGWSLQTNTFVDLIAATTFHFWRSMFH